MTDNDTNSRRLDVGDIDKVIHEPARLGIVVHLYVLDSADALFLKNQMELSWGNLSSHLTKLEDADYIEVIKEFVDRKPVTSFRLTQKGREAFQKYRLRIKGLLDDLQP